jgi:hypothetical protein
LKIKTNIDYSKFRKTLQEISNIIEKYELYKDVIEYNIKLKAEKKGKKTKKIE